MENPHKSLQIMIITEIQLGSHVHMLPMLKKTYFKVSKNSKEKFQMYISKIHMPS
jgi:hypothetical protein